MEIMEIMEVLWKFYGNYGCFFQPPPDEGLRTGTNKMFTKKQQSRFFINVISEHQDTSSHEQQHIHDSLHEDGYKAL